MSSDIQKSKSVPKKIGIQKKTSDKVKVVMMSEQQKAKLAHETVKNFNTIAGAPKPAAV